MLRALPLMFLALFLCGCAASGTSGKERLSLEEGVPTRVSFVDYRNGVRMTLVNEAHTDPVELYSELRTNANTKVISNEVMARMVKYFGEEGFNAHALRGYAPAAARGGELQSIEVESPGETLFLATVGGESAAANAFRECRTAFLQIQEMTMQAQAIKNEGGDVMFKQPEPSKKKQRD